MILANCKKCNGTGLQLNYSRGADLKSKCTNCGGRGFINLINEPKNRDHRTDKIAFSFDGGKTYKRAVLFFDDNYDYQSIFSRFNEKNTDNQLIAAIK